MSPADKINLEQICILLVDDNLQALEIIGQVVAGFGARNVLRCANVAEAKKTLKRTKVDLILTDGNMPDEDGYDLVGWLRREASEPNRFAPTIIVTGHTRQSQVRRARDCGANFVVSKPITPGVLLERIVWVASDERSFVDCDAYAGPDRRFKFEGPPPDIDGRRKNDLPAEVGAAEEPNLSQTELDSMLKVAKVAL